MTSTPTNADNPRPNKLPGRKPSNAFSGGSLSLWIALSAALILLVALTGICWSVRNSLRSSSRETLQSILASNVTAMQLWLSQRRADVARLASDKELKTQSLALLKQFAMQPKLDASALSKADAAQQLSKLKTVGRTNDEYLGWLVIDMTGRVLASSRRSLIGTQFQLPADAIEQFDGGQSCVLPPLRLPVGVSDSGSLSKDDGVMLAVAPISEGLSALGGFALMMDPLDQFSGILSASRTGSTGESFAFDRRGVLISQSRFDKRLRDTGLLEPKSPSPLNIKLVVPGANGATPASENSVLTVLADQATRGGTGADVSGYRNYLGDTVIGAWQWLPNERIGVGTEIHYTEAFSTLTTLRNSLAGIFLLACVGGVALVALLRHRGDDLGGRNALTRRMGQYQLGNVIGQGGMGSVYHGRHQLLKRDVAVKVLEHTQATRRSLSRFEREVQMTAKLCHPNTIQIYDYGRTDEGTFFYVMEYVDGISLQQLIDHYGRQPPERVIYMMLQICGSISEAHKQSMIHRDIKPANILLSARAGLFDLIKVLDFGLVKDINRDTVELTITESMTGTPLYMSPEAVRDASKADRRSDVYSIGAVGYTLLTGLPTFDGESSADICVKQLNEEPQRPSQRIGRDLSDDLQNILMSCLRKDADERPASADDLADALMQCKDFGHWGIADAQQWWEEVFDGPRDDLGQLHDNSRPKADAALPSKVGRRQNRPSTQRPGSDTKVNDLGDHAPISADEPSEETA